MLKKSMNQLLSKKVNQWLETITDEELRKEILKGLVITGGCFPSMIMNEIPKDFDCYFKTKELTKKVAEYYAKVWNDGHTTSTVSVIDCDEEWIELEKMTQEEKEFFEENPSYNKTKGITMPFDEHRIKMYIQTGIVGDLESVIADEELGLPQGSVEETVKELDETSADEILKEEKRKYFPVFISDNAITLSDGIQIVVRFHGEPDKIHDTYDFVHTKAYWTKETGTVIPNEVYEAVINKTLIYTGSKYPVCSVFRLRKFIERGWKINVGQILKMCMQISELNLQDINILSSQLIGVDSLYMLSLLEQFRKKKENDPNFDLTSNYVMSIIDKIF